MDTKRKLIGTAAIVAGVGLGTIAGAMFGAPSVSGAAEQAVAVAAHPGPGPGARGHGLGVAAEAIGIEADELLAALRDGQTIAEVAEANGVEAQAVVDALVADATARIDARVAAGDLDAERAEEIKANLPERMTALVNGEHRRHRPGHCDEAGEAGEEG